MLMKMNIMYTDFLTSQPFLINYKMKEGCFAGRKYNESVDGGNHVLPLY